IAKDAQANRWINAARYLTPLFKVAERITLGCLRFHQSFLLQSFRPKSRNPVVEFRVGWDAPSTSLRAAHDGICNHCKALQRESCRSAASPIALFVINDD